MPLQHRPRGRPKGTGINDRQRLRDIATLISTQPQIKPTTAIKMLGEHDPSVIRRLRDKFYGMQGELMDEVRLGRPVSSTASAVIRTLPGAAGMPLRPVAPAATAPLPVPSDDMAARERVDAAVGGLVWSRMSEAIGHAGAAVAAAAAQPSDPGRIAPRPPLGLPIEAPQSRDLAARASAATPDPTEIDLERARLMDLASYNIMLGLAIQATVTAIGHQARICEETFRLPPIAALLRQQIAIGEMVMSMTFPASQRALQSPQVQRG